MRLRLILRAAGLLMAGASGVILLLSGPAAASASPEGMWWTEDHTGVIRIFRCPEGMCGRIVGQTEPRDAQGHITLDVNGVPHCGLVFLHGSETDEPGHYAGIVTDPDSGNNWHCRFWVGADGSLRLRGYVLIPALGQTQTWPLFHGRVAEDCTIS